jgi:hypothetical protein
MRAASAGGLRHQQLRAATDAGPAAGLFLIDAA